MTQSSDSKVSFFQQPDKTGTLGDLPQNIRISDDLYLRKVLPDDAPGLYDLLQRNSDIPARVAWARDVRSVKDIIPNLQRGLNKDMDGRYAILVNEQLVGAVWTFHGHQSKEYGIGYCLDRSSRGKGYATGAVRVLIKELTAIGAKHIYFQVVPENAASIAIAKRIGCQPAETVMGKDFPVLQQRWRMKI